MQVGVVSECRCDAQAQMLGMRRATRNGEHRHSGGGHARLRMSPDQLIVHASIRSEILKCGRY